MKRLLLAILALFIIFPVYAEVVITYDNAIFTPPAPVNNTTTSMPVQLAIFSNHYAVAPANITFTVQITNTNSSINLTNSTLLWSIPTNWTLINGSNSTILGTINSTQTNVSIVLTSPYANGSYDVTANFYSDQDNDSITSSVTINTDPTPKYSYSLQSELTGYQNFTTDYTITVNNIGVVPITGVFGKLTGITNSWYRISNVSLIQPGDTYRLNLTITPTTIGNYSFNLTMNASGIIKTSYHNLTVFASNSNNNTNNTGNQNNNNQSNNQSNNQQNGNNNGNGNNNTSGGTNDGSNESTTNNTIPPKNQSAPSTSSKVATTIGISVVVLAILAIIGYFAVRYFKKRSEQSVDDIIMSIPVGKHTEDSNEQ